MMESHTSASLLARLGGDARDAASWAEFVKRYGPRIGAWCRQWRLQAADADDVTQDILLRVARHMGRFRYDPGKSFRGWLKAVARSAWADWHEAQAKPGRGSGDTGVGRLLAGVEAGDDLWRAIEDEYDRELLDAATARVRLRVEPHTWEAFKLQAFDGRSGAEVAAALGMQVGAVYVAKSKVQKLLRDEIAKLDGGGGGG